MSADPAWTEEIRQAALTLARVAALRHQASDRTLRYFLTSAVSHGVTVAELADVTRLPPSAIDELLDPVAG